MNKKEIIMFSFRIAGLYAIIANIINLLSKLIILPPLVKSNMYVVIFIHLFPYVAIIIIGLLLQIIYSKLFKDSVSNRAFNILANTTIGLLLVVNSIYLIMSLISQNLSSYYSLRSMLTDDVISDRALRNTIILFGYQIILYIIELAIGLFFFFKNLTNSLYKA